MTNVADAALRETGEKLAAELEAAGLDVLLDDRDERAGVKFKDADLVGIPYRINVGKKAASGMVELVTRATATSVDVALKSVRWCRGWKKTSCSGRQDLADSFSSVRLLRDADDETRMVRQAQRMTIAGYEGSDDGIEDQTGIPTADSRGCAGAALRGD